MKPVGRSGSVDAALEALVAGRQRDPFAVLGPHRLPSEPFVVVRAIHPSALAVELRLVETGVLHPMTRRDPGGIFEIRLPGDRIPD